MTVPTSVLGKIGELLGDASQGSAFAARRNVDTDDLHLEVKGIGRLRFPVSRAQAKRLCAVARPARYGLRDETLLDPRVRNTWEIAKSRVKIDQRRWKRSLLPVLDQLRRDLGLPDGCALKAELHNMLVYAPGQFFLSHQDSEKGDDMVGTLVVMMPSVFKGGAMVIEHRGEKVTCRGSKKSLSLIAFYADCHHEVQPVKEGYRVVLTYNLMLESSGDVVATSGAQPSTLAALAGLVREHFATPRPARRLWRTTRVTRPDDGRHVGDEGTDLPPSRGAGAAGDGEHGAPAEPPSRLVYLLDHQYTERSLGWHRLKGNDAARAALLRAAAEQVGCEAALALAEVHETWDCLEPGWEDPWAEWDRGWGWDDEEDEEDDDEGAAGEDGTVDDPDGYTLTDRLDWSVALDRWLVGTRKKLERIATTISGDELCYSTPSVELEPYAAEYEGFMGNWGNTMDRWYRRAAVVLWPEDRAFATRAEASPSWALESLKKRIRAGSYHEAQELCESLLPFWSHAAQREERRGFFGKALDVATGIESAGVAASLLQPFHVDSVTPQRAPAFVRLVERYGEEWTRDLLAQWRATDAAWQYCDDGERHAWLTTLPRLCEALRAADLATGTVAALLVLQDQWDWLRQEIGVAREAESPREREAMLLELAPPLVAFLEATALAGGPAATARRKDFAHLRDETIAFLCARENESLLPCLTRMLRTASESMSAEAQAAAGLDALRGHCIDLLQARLAVPERDANDWSLDFGDHCGCDLCNTLADFLTAPNQQKLEWPLNTQRRKHVHRIIDRHELPVRHQTRRSGRPFTLVLTKTKALFEREAATRGAWQADLAWLSE